MKLFSHVPCSVNSHRFGKFIIETGGKCKNLSRLTFKKWVWVGKFGFFSGFAHKENSLNWYRNGSGWEMGIFLAEMWWVGWVYGSSNWRFHDSHGRKTFRRRAARVSIRAALPLSIPDRWWFFIQLLLQHLIIPYLDTAIYSQQRTPPVIISFDCQATIWEMEVRPLPQFYRPGDWALERLSNLRHS